MKNLPKMDEVPLEKVDLIVRKLENAQIPEVDPSQTDDPHLTQKLKLLFERYFEYRDYDMKKTGEIVQRQEIGSRCTTSVMSFLDQHTHEPKFASSMCHKSVQNAAASIKRLLQSPTRLNDHALEDFKNYIYFQWNERGRKAVMSVFRDPVFIEKMRVFDPWDDIIKRSNWCAGKKREALIALCEGIDKPISNHIVCTSLFVKSGEKSFFEVPFENLVENETTDERARPRAVCPNFGEKHLTWLQQIIFMFFKQLFPHSYIQGYDP